MSFSWRVSYGLTLVVCVATAELPLTSYAQTVALHDRSSVPPDARFEIVQSSLAARYTFRLDRFTGEVWQITMASDSTHVWDRVPRDPHSVADTRIPGRVNYEIFLSGLAAKFMYLMNLNTGATWEFAHNSDGGMALQPIR